MPDFELPDVLTDVDGTRAAVLVIDGLSVFCFNKTSAERFWEVAFPRQRQHDLKITIQELDGDGNEVGEAIPHDIDRRVEQFTIRLTNGSLAHYDLFPEGGPWADDFDRNSPDRHPHDLQWMVDLAGDEIGHGNFLRLKPRHPSRPRSLASIRHSLFCNLEPEAAPARISPRSGNHPDADGNFDLGPTNTFMIGVLLGRTPAGEIQFEFLPDDLTTINPHPYDENKSYRIEIINNDTGNPQSAGHFVRGDLRLYYDELIEVSGPEKDLWAIPNVEVSPDGDCHGTRFSRATLGP